MRSVLLGLFVVAVLGACSEPPPRTAQRPGDQVPANSLDDARLHPDAGPGTEQHDPSQPLLVKVGEAPPPEPAEGEPAKLAKPAGKPGPASGGKGAVSKAECDRVMDRYLGLEIASNPQLKGLPPEVIEQAKQSAREQHGEAPCTATRSQYTCGMAAQTTAAWQRCMK